MNVSNCDDSGCEYISYSAKKEIEAVCSWYHHWKREERTQFVLQVAKLVNPNVDDLLSILGNIKIEK